MEYIIFTLLALALCSFSQPTARSEAQQRATTPPAHHTVIPVACCHQKEKSRITVDGKGMTSIAAGPNSANSTSLRKRQFQYFHQDKVFESQKAGGENLQEMITPSFSMLSSLMG